MHRCCWLIRTVAAALVMAGALASCDPQPDWPDISDTTTRPGAYLLPLIETTDIHGHILSTDGTTVHYRMAYIADKVRDHRTAHGGYNPDRILLLDGGDLYQGASVSNLLDGEPVFTVIDRMAYDAVALGNHEFDWGIENTVDSDATVPGYDWEGRHYDGGVPVVCANLYQDGSRASFTRDYIIVDKYAFNESGDSVKVRIGIIGYAASYAGSILPTHFSDLGYTIDGDYSMAGEIAAELERSGQCDATVLLTHEAAETAAGKLGHGGAIDLVLGGHSHRTASGRTDMGMAYLQGGRYCEHYASADLRFTVDGRGNLSFTSVENLQTPSVDASRDIHTSAGQNSDDLDQDILKVLDKALEETSAQFNDVIGYITIGATSWYLGGSGERAATISNWMCDITRSIGRADVAFINSGSIRTTIPLASGQKRRDITVADIYEIFPFNNLIYVYRITYAELLQLFEFSMTSGGESIFSRVSGIDCYYTQTTHTYSGGTYTTSAVHSLSKDGTVIYQNKKWTDDWATRTVTVAASEFLATAERTDYYTGKSNPLPQWNSTSRLVINTLVDNENAVRVLRAEAAAANGHLYIDNKPHFILKIN